MRIDDAVLRMNSIRQQLTVVESRRAFRSISIVVSMGVVGLAGTNVLGDSGGLNKELLVTQQFIAKWIGVAFLCALLMTIELVVRIRSEQSRITVGWSRRVVIAMLPPIVAGALLTWAIHDRPGLASNLPALWAVLYGLAIVNARHLLPRLSQCAAVWFVFVATLALRYPDVFNFSADQLMMFLFGTGQLLLAIGLYSGVKPNGKE